MSSASDLRSEVSLLVDTNGEGQSGREMTRNGKHLSSRSNNVNSSDSSGIPRECTHSLQQLVCYISFAMSFNCLSTKVFFGCRNENVFNIYTSLKY